MRASRLARLSLIAFSLAAACRKRPKDEPTAGPLDAGAAPHVANAAASFASLPSQAITSPDGVRYVKRSGFVASFDGLPLAVDLTVPDDGARGPRPLVAFFHGWAGDKKVWESDTIDAPDPAHARFNNVSFVARGYAVLNYTIRGWHDSCGPGRASSRSVPATLPPECKSRAYWVHVADPAVEIRDAQHLIGLLVDDGIADAEKIGVAGGSYGGAHAWMLALENDRARMPDGALVPWRSPAGRALHVAAAAPLYTWASLTAALLPNGRTTDRDGDAPRLARDPVGIPLGTYLTGFFAGGPATANGFYARPGADATADFTAWFVRFTAGAPFVDDPRVDPLLHRALDELDRRSPLHMAANGTVPVFQVQGLTDPLFPALHALVMRNKLLAVDPAWPVATFLGDVGHDNAQNPREEWDVAHAALDAFFDHHLKGAVEPPRYDVTVMTTSCSPSVKRRTLRGPSLTALARGSVALRSSTSRTTTNMSVHPDSARVDPLIVKGCHVLPADRFAPSAWTFAAPRAFTLVGSPEIVLSARILGNDANVHARIWDVGPAPHDNASQTLVSRGTYRWVAPSRIGTLAAQRLAFQTSTAAWDVPADHSIRVEIVGNAAPELQTNNLPATLTIESIELRLPTAD
jgi:pimeloyl-ACP methyl ester carboxylesterase